MRATAPRPLLLILAAAALAAPAAAFAHVAVTPVPGDSSRCADLCYETILEELEEREIEAETAPPGSRGNPARGLRRSGAEMLIVADVVGPRNRRAVRLRAYLPGGSVLFDRRERTRQGRQAARTLARLVGDLLDEGLDAFADEDRDEDRADEDRYDDDERPVETFDEPEVRTFGQDVEEEGEGTVRSRARVDRGSASRGTFLWLQAAVNVTARTMYMPLAGEEEAREYRGGAYPGFEVAGAFYPAAPWVATWEGNFGLYARYGRHITLSTYLDGQVLPTHQDQVDVQAVYRIPLLGRRSGPALIPAVGYQRVAFQVPETGLVNDFVYQGMSFGLDFEAPLPWAGLMLRGGGRYGMVMNMGDAGRAYAQRATVHGFQGNIELSGRIYAGFRYFVAVEVFGYLADLEGRGDIAEATGATDIFARGRAGLAYAFEGG